jgi:hypothetical protein
LRNKNFQISWHTCLRGGLLCRSAAKDRPLFGIGRPQGVFPAKLSIPVASISYGCASIPTAEFRIISKEEIKDAYQEYIKS